MDSQAVDAGLLHENFGLARDPSRVGTECCQRQDDASRLDAQEGQYEDIPQPFNVKTFYVKKSHYQRPTACRVRNSPHVLRSALDTKVLWPELFLKRADCYRELEDMEREKADRKKAHGREESQK